MFFGSLSSVNPLKCVSMNKQKCKVRPEIANVNSHEPFFYPFSIKPNKRSVSSVIISIIHMQKYVFLM